MAEATIIGQGTHIQGRVSGAVDLEIHGRIDGEVAVDGDVTIEATGLVGSSVSARSLVVRGAVRGDLTGEQSVHLEDGARVVGDIRAPRVAITKGALVRGHVQTGDGAHAAPRAKAQAHATRPAEAFTAAKAAPVKASRPEPVALRKAAPERTGLLAGAAPKAKGPPPPVVPVLKKGARGALKKKAV